MKKVGAGLVAIGAALAAAWHWSQTEPPKYRTAAAPATPRRASAVPPRASAVPPRASAARPVSAPAPVARAAAPIDARPRDEDTYLGELETLRARDPEAALEWVERGDAWYPGEGVRAEARRAMRITLLVDLGRMDEARAFARRFITAHPESTYRPVVQGLTGLHPRPWGPDGRERL